MSDASLNAQPGLPPAPARTASPGVRRLLWLEMGRSLRYSQFVARAKFVLPLTAGALIVSVAAWPSLQSGFQRLRTAMPRLDASQMHDLRMVNPRYTGLDRDNRPYTITADAARQSGTNTRNADDLVALEGPKADILTREGAWVVVAGNTGVYQPGAQLLDLFGNVTLLHDKGYRFKTDSARVDVNAGTAEGHEPVSGDGTSGTVHSAGFKILQKGDVVVFTGKSTLVMNGAPGGGK